MAVCFVSFSGLGMGLCETNRINHWCSVGTKIPNQGYVRKNTRSCKHRYVRKNTRSFKHWYVRRNFLIWVKTAEIPI